MVLWRLVFLDNGLIGTVMAVMITGIYMFIYRKQLGRVREKLHNRNGRNKGMTNISFGGKNGRQR